jgi:hypothetical protein
MSMIAAAQWTAVATIALAVFAVVTAVFAFLAYRKQSEELRSIEAHMTDLRDWAGRRLSCCGSSSASWTCCASSSRSSALSTPGIQKCRNSKRRNSRPHSSSANEKSFKGNAARTRRPLPSRRTRGSRRLARRPEAKDALPLRYAHGEISREEYLQGEVELED